MKKKRVAILLVFSCLSVSFAACSNGSSGNVDYGLEENSTEGVIGSTLAQFANEEKWTESFTVTKADGQPMEVQIDAEIRIPSVDHMSVMEVKEPALDYSVIEDMPYPIQKEFTYMGTGEAINLDWESRFIHFYPEDQGELHVPEEQRTGEIRYQAAFWEEEPDKDNRCNLSEEEAEEMAADFLEQMGISVSYYQVEQHVGLVWFDDFYSTEPYMEDGHYISYILKDDLGNDLITSLDNYVNIESKFSGNSYELNPQINISLVDEGVMEVSLSNAVQVIGITPVQNYMSFDAVKQSLRKVISEEFDKVYIPRSNQDTSEELIINSAELTYFRIRDKERSDFYSYIPVWLFCHHTETGGEIIDDTVYNPILINALDGSVIYLEEEL